MKKPVVWIVIFLGMLFILSLLIAGIFSLSISSDLEGDGNVAVIAVEGMIASGEAGPFGTEYASSDSIVKLIEKADKDPQIKAILFRVNSGGGTAVASEEIVRAIKRTNKTTVAWIRDVGASGAYWVSSATDHIVASPMTITGSVGVIGSYIEFAGLLEKYNVTYRRLVAGKYKDIGSPLKEMTAEEELLLQTHLDTIYAYFLDDVMKNRNLTISEGFDQAQIMGGKDALDLGLIDELGGRYEAVAWIEKELNMTVELTPFERRVSLFDVLSGVMNEKSFYV
ncbi:MAG: signal peptide peptidase SppA, partial [Nanoarchaeota archaeon]|nr:signal peptide peptidase SppA [Nanoarchaeota archaeon]